MKTISEAADEYATQERTTHSEQSAFADGALWAQQWIDVKNELPENIDNVLVKILCEPHPPTRAATPVQKEPFTITTLGNYYKGLGGRWDIIHNLIANGFHAKSWTVTHWRPIERK